MRDPRSCFDADGDATDSWARRSLQAKAKAGRRMLGCDRAHGTLQPFNSG